MTACDHIVCLRHVENERTGEIVLEDTGRFWRVVQELPKPSVQTPQLALFIGTNAKDNALKHIYPQNNIGRRGERGNINLHLETKSINHETPVFFAESSPFVKNPSQRSHVLCHETLSYSIRWKADLYAVIDILYARLLFLFSDVICLFADDFSSVEAVLLRLMTWVEIGSAMSLLPELRPRLLIIVSEDGPHDSLKHDLLRKALQFHAVQLNNVFSAAQTFQLAGTYLSPLARYQRLQHEIRTQTQQMLELKQKSHMLLSAYHLASFFAKAVEKLAQSRSGEFSFFSESRRRNEIGTDYQRHIETFLAQAQRQRTPYDSIASFIATSILMDAYPPRMHRQWLPRLRDLSDPADPPRLSN